MADSGSTDPRKPQKPSRFLKVDAWLDSALYTLRSSLARFWEAVTVASDRMRVRGVKRLFVELADEAFSFGVAGFVILLALALPAFEETRKDWRNKTDISVTFLDRYGNPIGQRGVLQKTGVPLDELPDFVIKAVLATEDRRFF